MKPNTNVLNAYRVMWVFVFFDLPVVSDKQRKRATRFRKDLLECGFNMYQYSVYQRFCGSRESMDSIIRYVESLMPKEGHISIMQLTDKQYGLIKNLWGKIEVPMKAAPHQLEFF